MAKAIIISPEGSKVIKHKDLPLTLTQDESEIVIRDNKQKVVAQKPASHSVHISGPHHNLEAGKTVLYAKSTVDIRARAPVDSDN